MVLLLRRDRNCTAGFFQTVHADLLPRRFEEGHGKGSGCVISLVTKNLLTEYKAFNSITPCLFVLDLFDQNKNKYIKRIIDLYHLQKTSYFGISMSGLVVPYSFRNNIISKCDGQGLVII